MKRIICTVTNDLSFDQRMIRTCNSLSRHGYDVLLVGRTLKRSLPLSQQPYRQKRLRLLFSKGKLFYLEYNLRLLFFLLFRPFDIVCSVDLDTLLPGFVVSRLKRKVCVYDAHEYFSEVPEVVDRPLVRKIWEQIAGFVLPKLHYAYTVNESLAECFQQKYGIPFSVIRNVPGRSPSSSYPEKSRRPFVLLYQGVLNVGRGLEAAIQAVSQLKDMELWLAGEGDLSAELRKRVNELGVGDRVHFLGLIPPPALKQLTPKAHVGLNLLENKGLNYYYSLANKAFDYIQAGLPAVSMAFPEYVRINKKYRVFYLLEDLDVPKLVEALKELQENESFYNELRKNCIEAARELTWEKEEQKLIAFYRQIN